MDCTKGSDLSTCDNKLSRLGNIYFALIIELKSFIYENDDLRGNDG